MFDMKTAVRLGAVCAFASLIAGCGGGSGTLLDGSSPSPSATTAEQPVNSRWGQWFHQPDTVLVTVGGNGSVTSRPAAIDCTGSSGCSKSLPVGSTVTLSPFATAATVAAGIGGTTGSGGTTASGSTQASTPATTQASAQQVISPALYVSPTGSDSNAGTSAAAPFRTLTKAQTAMQGSSTKTTYVMGGTFSLSAALTLHTPADDGESWLGYPGQTPILDGGNTVQMAISVGGNNITIRWLTIQNFAQSGILAQNVSGVLIDSNSIQNIHSTGFNQGGIISLNTFTNGTISHNLVQNTGWTGIAVGTSTLDNISNLVIDSNGVYNTCTTVTDCGAIYADDRGHVSTGISITHNIVGNFGPPLVATKGIYLDDQLSNATVTNNIVYGTGQYAFQIHGGDHDVFKNNIFDISSLQRLAAYQDDGATAPNYGMAGNVFTDNIVYSSTAQTTALWAVTILSSDALPNDAHNLYWNTSGTQFVPGTGNGVADTDPPVANPGFVNAAANNYNFTSGAPAISGGSFAPINVSTVGPIPNP
jgi:hypothetical protein